jgi:hypothetical protein
MPLLWRTRAVVPSHVSAHTSPSRCRAASTGCAVAPGGATVVPANSSASAASRSRPIARNACAASHASLVARSPFGRVAELSKGSSGGVMDVGTEEVSDTFINRPRRLELRQRRAPISQQGGQQCQRPCHRAAVGCRDALDDAQPGVWLEPIPHLRSEGAVAQHHRSLCQLRHDRQPLRVPG